MFFILLVFVALALYGGFAILEDLGASPTAAPNPEADGATSTPVSGLGPLGDFAVRSVAGAAGVSLSGLPDEGCSTSMLSPVQVEELVMSLPEPQQIALAKVLTASASVWTAQAYRGEKGVGLCLPQQNTLVLLPAGMAAPLEGLAGAVMQ